MNNAETSEPTFSASRAMALQREMAKHVIIEPLPPERVTVAAGLDVAYSGSTGFAVAVAIHREGLRELCHVVVESSVEIPYVPGLLAFREAPIMVAALQELMEKCVRPDVVMVNGHGLSHPRRLGIATHIGLALDIPTIGIARKRLCGEVGTFNGRKALFIDGRPLCYIVGEGRRETYVSIGHRVDLETALAIAQVFWRSGSRFPEPIAVADQISKRVARSRRSSRGRSSQHRTSSLEP